MFACYESWNNDYLDFRSASFLYNSEVETVHISL